MQMPRVSKNDIHQEDLFNKSISLSGIMQLIQNCEPKNVMLVHGEAEKMKFLRAKIRDEFNLETYMPANGETCVISTPVKIPVDASISLLKAEARAYNAQPPDPKRRRLIHGILVMKDNRIMLQNLTDALKEIGINRHVMRFTSKVKMDDPGPKLRTIEKLKLLLEEKLTGWTVILQENGTIAIESVEVNVEEDEKDPKQKTLLITWTNQDEDIGAYVLNVLQNMC